MSKPGGLGRGLGALIPSELSAPDGEAAFREIPVSQITANRLQPRERFDEQALLALSDSVRELGVLQPILVRQRDDGGYELIAGERRWRAAQRAGLASVPAIIRRADDTASLEQALVENLHRQDLNPLEEASAYRQLIEDFGMSQEEVARRVGRSRPAVSNTMRLLQLPPAIQRLLLEGALSAGHARALLGSPDRAFQEGLARRAAAEGLSVRDVEEAVRSRDELTAKVAGTSRPNPPAPGEADHAPDPRADSTTESRTEESLAARAELSDGLDRPAALPERGPRPPADGAGADGAAASQLELERLLADHLDTRVSVNLGAAKGRITIEFADLADLERIYRRIVRR
ncbi:MAG: ParB/RepB/Spo0J family partition protein [Acidimicrobiales bacterium]